VEKVSRRFQSKAQDVAVPNIEISHTSIFVNTFRQIGRYWKNRVPNQNAERLLKKN
jgi:hypothetical protein